MKIHTALKKNQPNLLGDGIHLFDNLAGYSIDLEKIHVIKKPDVTHLHFRVVK
jgi:hypothetical protein